MLPNFWTSTLHAPLLGLLLSWLISTPSQGQEPFDFAHRVVPILKKHCVECHAGDQKKGSFSLNSRETLLAGGESGEEILPANSASSELLARVTSTDKDMRMPPEGAGLSDSEIATLREWAQSG
ncbi:MAG: c-type cytochrome domain-containing protein, partial [Pirellula sp.]